MAKPIRATPSISGEDAEKFIRKMILVDRSQINRQDKEIAEDIEKNSKFFVTC